MKSVRTLLIILLTLSAVMVLRSAYNDAYDTKKIVLIPRR